MSATRPAPLISVVIPAHNEAANLPVLADEVAAALGGAGLAWELIVVNDGSDDTTAVVLAGLVRHHAQLVALHHPAPFGQSAALVTGWRAARGALVVTMDGDLQHDPADIPALLAALADDAAAITGYRPHRHDNTVRRASSRVANAFRRAITGDAIRDAGCTLRVIRREALAEVPVFNGVHRFLPTLLRAQGYRVDEHPIHHRPRRHGRSHYGIHNRLWRGIADCLAVRWYTRRALPGAHIRTALARPAPGGPGALAAPDAATPVRPALAPQP